MEPRQLFSLRRATARRIVLLFASLGLAFSTAAQNYSIDWHKIAGGGGTSTNAQYSVSGTIGQHDAGGPMIGGSYSLTGGYWSLFNAVQTPGAPLLSIRLTGPNSATVSWPVSSTTFTLEQKGNLGAAGWATVTNAVTVLAGQNQVTISPLSGIQFFRLKYP